MRDKISVLSIFYRHTTSLTSPEEIMPLWCNNKQSGGKKVLTTTREKNQVGLGVSITALFLVLLIRYALHCQHCHVGIYSHCSQRLDTSWLSLSWPKQSPRRMEPTRRYRGAQFVSCAEERPATRLWVAIALCACQQPSVMWRRNSGRGQLTTLYSTALLNHCHSVLGLYRQFGDWRPLVLLVLWVT